MILKELKLKNFRTYRELSLSLNQNVLIFGNNTEGKTNLLEAVYLLSLGRSFRAKEKDMVLWEEDYFRIEGHLKTNDEKLRLEYIFEPNIGRGRKTVKINGVKKPTTALLEGLRVVFFSPDELDIFFGFPSARRRYLNVLLSQTAKGYALEINKYGTVLTQRNQLLKMIAKGRAKENELEIWDGKLAEHGAKIMAEREAIIERINKSLKEAYRLIGKNDSLSVHYLPSLKGSNDIWASFIEKLLANRNIDIASGVTNHGPHRDDLVVLLAGNDISAFGSRGERRSAVLALKVAEKEVIFNQIGDQPLLLLDDVFSELDQHRRGALSQVLKDQQTIITTTDLDHFPEDLRKRSQLLEVTRGKAEEF